MTETAPPADPAAGKRLEDAGSLLEAMRAYGAAGQFRDAARVAWNLGLAADAADFSVRGGHHYEAGVCYQAAHLNQPALHQLVRTQPDDARYRDAATRVVQLCQLMGAVGLRVDNFLAPFLLDAPRDEGEIETLYQLGTLYQRAGMVGAARRMLERVMKANPLHRDVALRLATLPGMEPAAAASQALDEERGFRQRRRPTGTASAGGTGSRKQQTGTGEAPPPELTPAEGSSTVMIDLELETTESPGPTDTEFREGTIVADRYRLVRRLGKGGMAQVFEARDLDLGETVAVKLHDSVMASPDLEMRFKREVTLSRQFAHPNIIRVYDIGRIRGHKYLTMELLSGSDLEQTLKQKGVLSVREAVGFLLQVCAGLGSAHDLGAVHRDIKPANFFVHQGTVVKLTDFGIARDTRQPSRTGPGLIMGTPEYMAPEQFKNFSGVTLAADLYSVGIMAYRMVTGEVPFRASEFSQMAYLHVAQPPPSPRSKNPAVPPELEAIILRLLEKQPAARFANCHELAAALSAIKLD